MEFSDTYVRARHGVWRQGMFENRLLLLLLGNKPKMPRSERGVCGAKTRRNTPCQAPPVWNKSRDVARNGRCKLHGGKSTGPKTKVGREAIRASNRRRRKI